MAKAKRMSDIFKSSAEKDISATTTTATPPYSSEGPTLPLMDGCGEHAAGINGHGTDVSTPKNEEGVTKKKRPQDSLLKNSANQAQPIATNHPALYEPWTLLPRELLGPLLSQSRLADVQNVVPIVFTKNQNIKGGIVRLKTYLGAHVDRKNPMEVPEALKEKGCILAISAQGEGTAKLVTIVDMARRVVAPTIAVPADDKTVETWWIYMSLASVEVQPKKKTSAKDIAPSEEVPSPETQEEEAFEPMEVDVSDQKKDEEPKAMRKVPVLTIWMSRKSIAAFKEAFGEQSFAVQTLPKED